MNEGKTDVEEERKARAESCRQQIEQILKAYDCRIEAGMYLTATVIMPQIRIVAN